MTDESETVSDEDIAKRRAQAAVRALEEAEQRRKERQAAALPLEKGGRRGPEPTRYGDWEKKESRRIFRAFSGNEVSEAKRSRPLLGAFIAPGQKWEPVLLSRLRFRPKMRQNKSLERFHDSTFIESALEINPSFHD